MQALGQSDYIAVAFLDQGAELPIFDARGLAQLRVAPVARGARSGARGFLAVPGSGAPGSGARGFLAIPGLEWQEKRPNPGRCRTDAELPSVGDHT